MGIILIDKKNKIISDLISSKGNAVVGYLWECGADCNCRKPVIEKFTEHKHYPFIWWQTERLWEGSYITDDSDGYKTREKLIDEIKKQKTIEVDYIYE